MFFKFFPKKRTKQLNYLKNVIIFASKSLGNHSFFVYS